MSEEKTSAPPTPKPSGQGLVVVLAATNVLATLGVGAAIWLTRPAPVAPQAEGAAGAAAANPAQATGEGGAAQAPADPAAAMFKLDRLVVQLKNPEVDRYARVAFEIEAASAKEAERLKADEPRVRDAFIAYLSDRSYEELRGSAGLARVKSELLDRLKKVVPEGTARDLYITDFVVQ